MGAGQIRFGVGASGLRTRDDLVAAAREAERLGYSTFGLADHVVSPMAPLVALQAVADATSTLRVATRVLNQDLRHPAVLAKELATLDVLSGGRLEVGLGAGWMAADYHHAGLPFDAASTRIERLEEYVEIVGGLLAGGPLTYAGRSFDIRELSGSPASAQLPRPPILIGGGGRKLLTLAGRAADIVGIATRNAHGTLAIDPAELTADGIAQKVEWVREGAGGRFGGLELNLSLLGAEITDDRRAGAQTVLEKIGRLMAMSGGPGPAFGVDEILASPCFAIGTVHDVCEQLLGLRDRYGFSYFSISFGTSIEALAPVVELLARHEGDAR